MIYLILAIIAILTLFLVAWGLCAAAGKADEEMENEYQRHLNK